MAQFQVIDMYQRESNPGSSPILTITADAVDVQGTTAVFFTQGVKTALISLSSEFLVQEITKTGV